jgi:uncharacterized protein YwgA
MNRYQLAKLIAIAGKVHARKRVQKIVFLLQAAGLDFGATFRLHHFGPYSTEVASLLDEMSRQGILEEERYANVVGWQSEYSLTDDAKRSLAEFEETPKGRASAAQFREHERQLCRLLDVADLWELELGATIAYFRKKHGDWRKAVDEACKFKNVRPDAAKTEQALALARELVG